MQQRRPYVRPLEAKRERAKTEAAYNSNDDGDDATNASKGFNLSALITTGIRLGCLLTIPLAAVLPSAVSLFWCSASAYGIANNLAFRHPPLRRALGIKETAYDSLLPGTLSLCSNADASASVQFQLSRICAFLSPLSSFGPLACWWVSPRLCLLR